MTLKCVVNNTKKKRSEPKGLSHPELIEKLESAGDHLSREQIVVQNLKDMGL